MSFLDNSKNIIHKLADKKHLKSISHSSSKLTGRVQYIVATLLLFFTLIGNVIHYVIKYFTQIDQHISLPVHNPIPISTSSMLPYYMFLHHIAHSCEIDDDIFTQRIIQPLHEMEKREVAWMSIQEVLETVQRCHHTTMATMNINIFLDDSFQLLRSHFVRTMLFAMEDDIKKKALQRITLTATSTLEPFPLYIP